MNNQGTAPAEKLMKDMQTVMADFYHQVMSENVKRHMLRRAEAGYALQRPPFGYSTTETKGLFRVNRQGRALRQTMKRLAEGKISVEVFKVEMSLALNSHLSELRGKSDNRKLVTNPYYAGKISYGGELYQGLHEPLITPEEQQKLIESLEM